MRQCHNNSRTPALVVLADAQLIGIVFYNIKKISRLEPESLFLHIVLVGYVIERAELYLPLLFYSLLFYYSLFTIYS
jgi:hypothetical protein